MRSHLCRSACLVAALTAAAGCAGDTRDDLQAIAMSWPAAAGTDFDLDAWLEDDHTIFVKFAPQYPMATTAAVLGENGGGTYLFGTFDYNATIPGPKLVLAIGDRFEDWSFDMVPGQWVSAALVADREGDDIVYTVWANGRRLNPAFQVPVNALEFPTGSVRIGQRTSLAPGPIRQFYGLIDDVVVFDSALDDEDVEEMSALEYLFTGRERGVVATMLVEELDDADIPETSLDLSGTATIVDIEDHTSNASEHFVEPFAGTPLQLPFEPGVAWEVVRGYADRTTHHVGVGAFGLDFKVAGFPALPAYPEGTAGAPVLAAAPGTLIASDDSRASGQQPANFVEIEHDIGEYARYLHIQRGSGQGTLGLEVEAGTPIGLAGDVGATAPGVNQIHFELGSRPSSAESGVTYPAVFRDFERQADDGSWVPVSRAVLQEGDVVRRPGSGEADEK